VDTLATATAELSYANVQASLGSVDDEKGQRWSLGAREDYANSASSTKVHGTYDLGFALPIGHSSIWIRNSAGLSPQERSDPFANFYFGGFGNNYVDRYDEKHYRQLSSFPGVELNSIGGRNFVKSILEWNAPPVRFRRAGTPGFYVSWLRPAVFVGGLAANLDAGAFRSATTDVGAQCDIRMSALSSLDMTLSVGGAVAFDHGVRRHQLMLSLAVLR
jgi:hypothetical protein